MTFRRAVRASLVLVFAAGVGSGVYTVWSGFEGDAQLQQTQAEAVANNPSVPPEAYNPAAGDVTAAFNQVRAVSAAPSLSEEAVDQLRATFTNPNLKPDAHITDQQNRILVDRANYVKSHIDKNRSMK